MVTTSHSKKVVYTWLEGQYDNIGDSALRRGYLRALEQHGAVNVWPGKFQGYNSGLGIGESSKLSGSYSEWLTALYKSALRGNAVIALNAGQFGISKQFAGRLLLLAPALIVQRLRGGPNIWMGAATVRRPGRTWLLRALARLMTFLRWRDVDTPREVFASPTMPDWAFDLDALGEGTAKRSHIAVSLRGDRDFPSSSWIQAVRSLAERTGSELVVVVQVARDQERGEQLAEALGAGLAGWESDEHDRQERRVREIYNRSSLILSDRLHALIMAHTEGAVPLGWCEGANKKVRQHFDVVGFGRAQPRDSVVHDLESLDSEKLTKLKADAADSLQYAKRALADIKGELAVHLGASR